MGRISKVLREAEDGHGGKSLLFYCAGCGMAHQVWVGLGPGPRWGWNGDAERPTFTPSVLVTGQDFTAKGEADFEAWHAAGRPKPAPKFESAPLVCHTFVTDGRIQYLSDSTHALAGQTVDLPPFRWGIDDPDEPSEKD